MFAYVINISLNDFVENLPAYEEKFKNLIINSIHFAQIQVLKLIKKKDIKYLSFSSFLVLQQIL